jgi:hypothetical protein
MNITSIYLSGSFVNQPPGRKATSRVVDWMKSAFAANRARKTRLQTIHYLRRLAPAILDDIGVDVHALMSPIASIARTNPYVVAIEAATGTRLIKG